MVDWGSSFTFLFPLSHSWRHFRWIYFMVPEHLQGLMRRLSLSFSSPRQILQDFTIAGNIDLDFIWIGLGRTPMKSASKCSPNSTFWVLFRISSFSISKLLVVRPSRFLFSTYDSAKLATYYLIVLFLDSSSPKWCTWGLITIVFWKCNSRFSWN